MSTVGISRPPRWYSIFARVLFMTFIGTLLSFAISLLLAIILTVAIARVRRVPPDMTIAYRHIALPAAMVAGGVILVVIVVAEVRHYREMKALATIERIS